MTIFAFELHFETWNNNIHDHAMAIGSDNDNLIQWLTNVCEVGSAHNTS